MRNIFLIGFMGCGKSAVCVCMNKQYHLDCIDVDEEIVRREGASIPEIFEVKGESYFRELETQLLCEFQSIENVVIACGGGVPLKSENVRLMKENGVIVLLTASPETIFKRVKDDENRPLLQGNKTIEFIEKMLKDRMPKYKAAADIVVETDGKSIENICKEILESM